MYEALRAYFVEERPSAEVARDFNYSPGSFQVLCHHFRRDPEPSFFLSTRPSPPIEPVADVRQFSLTPRTFTTRCGGLFLFVPDLVRLKLDALVQAAHLPGSKMIPADHALRTCLALKLWSIERHSHVMALVADEGLALFAGLNAVLKKSYLSEDSSRIPHTKTSQLLGAWHDRVNPQGLFDGASFNLDFHSVPYYG